MPFPTCTAPFCCGQGSIVFELWKGAPAAFVALTIGWIAAGIAYRQYQVAHAKLKLDLFDKRYAIYQETWRILSEAATTVPLPKHGMYTPFNNLIPQAAFLFGKPVENYLNEAVRQWAKLRALQTLTQGSVNAVQPADIAAHAELQTWFHQEASQGAKELFGRYLNFEKWR